MNNRTRSFSERGSVKSEGVRKSQLLIDPAEKESVGVDYTTKAELQALIDAYKPPKDYTTYNT